MTVVEIAPTHRAQIEAAARAAFPHECCGLLEGRRDGGAIRVHAVHAVKNISDAADRFEIDPAEHIKHLRAARTRGNEIVGCYHSHPDGRAEPSPRDRAGASEEGFLWLIAATVADGADMRGYVLESGDFVSVPLIFPVAGEPKPSV
jgi:proteasome lid subunit RPN8/RPN11